MDSDGYIGAPKSAVNRVFGEAVSRARISEPTAAEIISRTKTHLGPEIVAAIIEAARLVLSPDRTPDGIQARREKEKQVAKKANSAEKAFLINFTTLGYHFQNEAQQRHFGGVTPDIRFREPTLICGHLCHWLEFKNFFGFRRNPFVARRNQDQLLRYAVEIGPGAVVYKLGFETNHIQIEGVKSFREKEVVESLTVQVSDESGAPGNETQEALSSHSVSNSLGDTGLGTTHQEDSSAQDAKPTEHMEESSLQAEFLVSTGTRKNKPKKRRPRSGFPPAQLNTNPSSTWVPSDATSGW